MAERAVVVATHGHCFDGLCSAVMFTRLLRHVEGARAGELRFAYHGAGYGPGQNGVDPAALTGDVNAILDFRYSTSPALTWYFDHHVSAFPQDADRASYLARTGARPRLAFHDGAYTSCTKLIADVGAREFALDAAPTAELVRWADMIDSAAFPSAAFAVERKHPVLQLMTVVEHGGDDAFLARMVPLLLERELEEVATSPEVAAAFAPLHDQHQAFVALVTSHARKVGHVVLVDLTDVPLEVAGKFVTYALFPESAYSVLVSRSRSKCKISIGYNPWSSVPRAHNIAAICERHGGGGHPVVGAISTTAGEVDKARALGLAIAEELAAPPAP